MKSTGCHTQSGNETKIHAYKSAVFGMKDVLVANHVKMSCGYLNTVSMELEPPYTAYFAVPQESTAGSFHLRFHSQTQKLGPPCTAYSTATMESTAQ